MEAPHILDLDSRWR